MAISQESRVAKIETPLGNDILGLARYDITEGLSELFEWRAEVVAEDHKVIDFSQYMGQGCTITHKSYTSNRVYHGCLVEANYVGVRGRFIVYNLIMRPWLWMLSRWHECRIFQQKTVPDIIKEVFQNRGFSDFEFRLHESHEKREYCVQYRETDLAFVSRLMEEEGIYYFFEHSQDKHVCVMTDSKAGHRKVQGLEKITWASVTGTDWFVQEYLFDWHSEKRLRTAKVEYNDYDYKKPGKSLKANSQGQAKQKFEFYDHPGNYIDTGLGEHRAKVRQEGEQALDGRRYATGDCAQLYPGGLVKLEKHPEGSENQEYLVVRTTHSYSTESYESESTPATSSGAYNGAYELQLKDRPYRAPIVTPRPLVYGMHMAIVTGPSGEEIYVDEDGRIKVQFFWDRYGKKDENSSCWIRVAQLWAGAKWGAQFIPRIGMEVIVTYEEGDPDRPFVIGCLYNGDNEYPYKMPGDKTQSGFKSNSTLNGGGGYNEFMFEDKKNNV
jgi:type VI secretion system secreted protein VgrG